MSDHFVKLRWTMVTCLTFVGDRDSASGKAKKAKMSVTVNALVKNIRGVGQNGFMMFTKQAVDGSCAFS